MSRHANPCRRLCACLPLRTWLLVLCIAMGTTGASGQRFLKIEKDTIPLLRGFALSFDLVGAAQMMFSDYGQYEGALRLNLHDQFFPIVELGVGRANHAEDEVTGLSYKTSAPYGRVGVDVNIMNKKHTGNRVFAGVRYGFTSYSVDIAKPVWADPVWQWPTRYDISDERCYQHWAELLFGVDARIAGPFHLGWSARYRFRVAHDEGNCGNTWYVPGYGKQDSSSLGATFNVIIDI